MLDFLASAPRGRRYRSISILGSSALKDVTQVGKDAKGAIRRMELTIWSRIVFERPDTATIRYGDYGVVHPDFIGGRGGPNANAKIRYTAGPNIHYFRGHSLQKPPKFAQYFGLARQVVEEAFFCNRGFSFGDAYIDDCANRRGGTGNLGSWVLADMNHHMTYAARQASRLSRRLNALSDATAIAGLLE